LGLRPDFWTFFSVFASIVGAVMLAQDRLVWGLLLAIVMDATDMLDGATARAGGTSTRFGTILDHVCDRYAEFFLVTGIALSGRVKPFWAIFAIFGMVMASYVRAKAESVGKMESCIVGFAGRQEKLILLMAGLFFEIVLVKVSVLNWTLIAVGLISHITAIQRLLYSRKMLLAHPPLQ
jgi:CDP-diacylglycerol--glycerol-3-phosphate 3-phosphatidyltransferase/archaetidylinositol phosphate synthase